MGDIAELQGQFLGEYSNLMDSSTILAILSDYDLSDASQLDTARRTLEILKSTVTIDEATGFDPSGASGADALIEPEGNATGEDESASARSARGWRSQTDATSLNQDIPVDLEALDFSDSSRRTESPHQAHPNLLDGLDEESKETVLVGMFPALKPFDIRWTLKKCKGDAGLAVDELMTQSFLEETGTRHRGIEAFSETNTGHGSRKARGKRKAKIHTDIYDSAQESPVSPDTPTSKWESGKRDVDFIAEKTGIPMQQVKSIYHNNNGSAPDTIIALIKAHADLDIEADDPMVQINAAELRESFPIISQTDMEMLVQISYPSIDNARALAEVLALRPIKTPRGIQVELRHAPLNLDPAPTKAKPKPLNAVYPRDGSSWPVSAAKAAGYYEARNSAFDQAAAAYKKGKSNHLMGGAAAYYSQVGRDLDAQGRSAESAAADALVASQSTRFELDLHGVNVKDAVRISREGVTTWWHELGELRASGRGVGSGYKIVTGMGKHSDGGRGKLGPAVGKMLLREGWKFEVTPGFLVVTGVAPKKK